MIQEEKQLQFPEKTLNYISRVSPIRNTLDILSRFIFRQHVKCIQQFAFLDKLHRILNDAFARIYAFDARQISRNVYYRHTLISSACVSRKTEDDLIAVRAYAILEAEANLCDRKIMADLVKVFIAASITLQTCRPDTENARYLRELRHYQDWPLLRGKIGEIIVY